MTRMTGPDCVVMCNLINTHTHTHTHTHTQDDRAGLRGYVQFNKYTHTHTHMWLSGRLHIEGRLNEGPRLQRKHEDEKRGKAKQNKTNVTPEKDVMTSANQTPGGHKFAPLVASQQGRANQHEPACFGLSSPWSFPSRSAIPLHAVVQPWFFLQRSISP